MMFIIRNNGETPSGMGFSMRLARRTPPLASGGTHDFFCDGDPDATLPVECRIIRVCNAYDDLVGSSLEGDRKLQAVAQLQLSTDREFDPRVVEVLTRIVERQLAHSY